MKLLVTGGGTGGHLSVAEALTQAAVARGHDISYVGSTSGQDRVWFEEHSAFTHTYFFETSGVVNRRGVSKVISLFKIMKAVLHVIKIIHKNKIEAVLSVGGFSAAPASFAAILMRKPLYIQEQNAKVGRLNSLLKPYSKEFFSVYEKDSKVQNYPINEHFFSSAHVREELKTIIFLGGSQGATFINDLALSVASVLQEKNIHIIHQCGTNDLDRVQKMYHDLGVEVELYGFTSKIERLINRSDLAVSRAGASTLWELTSNGLPTLFIPYPYAASDHQFYNALFIVKGEMGWCERENENPRDRLLEIVDENLQEKSKKLIETNAKNAAESMIKIVEGSR